MFKFSKFIRRPFITAPYRNFKVGFFGLGNMGIPMCQNIMKSGNELKAFDIAPEACAKARAQGIPITPNIATCAQGVNFIVTCLPNSKNVDDLLNKKGGIFDSADSGTIICDTSTILPSDSQKFYNQADKAKLFTYLDTPFSGGLSEAQNGTLTFMVGSQSQSEFNLAKILLETMGTDVYSCGVPGSGSIAKVINYLVTGIPEIPVKQALQLSEMLGADPQKMAKLYVQGIVIEKNKNYDEDQMLKFEDKDFEMIIDVENRKIQTALGKNQFQKIINDELTNQYVLSKVKTQENDLQNKSSKDFYDPKIIIRVRKNEFLREEEESSEPRKQENQKVAQKYKL